MQYIEKKVKKILLHTTSPALFGSAARLLAWIEVSPAEATPWPSLVHPGCSRSPVATMAKAQLAMPSTQPPALGGKQGAPRPRSALGPWPRSHPATWAPPTALGPAGAGGMKGARPPKRRRGHCNRVMEICSEEDKKLKGI